MSTTIDLGLVKGDTGEQGPQGEQGIQGAQGIQGEKGDAGDAATITVGTVTTGAAGTQATVVNSGTEHAAVFDITIPKGDKGETGGGATIDDTTTTTDATWSSDKINTLLATKEDTVNKNTANGYAGLGSDAQIPYVYASARVKRALDHQRPELIANPPSDWNLATRFADEISGYGNLALWLKARCAADDYSDMYAGDYFEMTLLGESSARKARALGLDTYKSSADSSVPSHIDFCAGLSSSTYQWNTTNNNNGTSAEPSPYRASNLFSKYANTILPLFPSWLSANITEKRALLPTRYSASGALTDDTSWAWGSMGKVWAFFEEEVTGQVYWQTKGLTGYFKHYPMFAIQPAWTAIFGRNYFWGAGAYSGHSTSACRFSYDGHCGDNSASISYCASLGFRISA